MVKIKSHIKIGHVYRVKQHWNCDFVNGENRPSKESWIDQDGIVILLDFSDLGDNSASVTFLYNNKIYIRNLVAKDGLNNLELII